MPYASKLWYDVTVRLLTLIIHSFNSGFPGMICTYLCVCVCVIQFYSVCIHHHHSQDKKLITTRMPPVLPLYNHTHLPLVYNPGQPLICFPLKNFCYFKIDNLLFCNCFMWISLLSSVCVCVCAFMHACIILKVLKTVLDRQCFIYTD